jgi:hypothetical protein
MMEKNSGKFPQWMINKCGYSELRKIFRDGAISRNQAEQQVQGWREIEYMRTSD